MKGVKRWLVLLLLLVVTRVTVYSQAAVAKLKFEEAEEAYVANDYATTIEKLDEVEKMLGETNPRILYLRIVAAGKQLKSSVYIDLEAASALKKNCNTYLVKYENVEGIEDKYKEVYKISESVRTFNTEDVAFANVAKGTATLSDIIKIADAYDMIDNNPRAFEWYTKAAAKNSSQAYYELFIYYMNGYGVKKDTVRGVEFLEKAVAANHPGAWYSKGFYYKSGRYGYGQDENKHKECLQKCYEAALPEVEKGNAQIMYYAARALTYGKLDTVKGIEILTKAAAKGDVSSMDMLANFYKYGDYVVKDTKKAMQLYLKAVDKGSSSAMYSIAFMYYRGDDGYTQDYNKAVEWFTKAAEHGHAAAAYMLGYMNIEPKGLTQDYATGITWYKLATSREHANACNNLGNLYYWGSGVTQDYAKAVSYYAKASDLGSVTAMNNAGNTYYKGGNGLTKDYGKAAEFYKRGMNEGYHWCYYNYGNMLYNGEGASVNYEKAAECYTKAAELNNTDAMDKLYSMYYNGTGVKRDKKLAEQWAAKAAAIKAKS